MNHPSKTKQESTNLLWRLFVAGGISDVIAFVLLFLPAGTFDFWQAWVCWGLFTAYLVFGTAWWLKTDPGLLERRLKVGPKAEKIGSEKIIVTFLLGYLCLWLTVPGFDRRFHWSDVTLCATVIGFVCSILGIAFVVWTANYNRYMAATITVEEKQPVISTGPYAWIRHPMYTGTLVWFFFTPLALGSWWGVPATLPMLVILLFRIVDEERYLREHLPGYADYCNKVRWRLLPFVF